MMTRGAGEQGDEADEARVELERGVVGGCRRGRAVIVWVPACLRASQLIAGVRQLREGGAQRTDWLHSRQRCSVWRWPM